MENFLFVFAFTIQILDKHDDIEGAKKMMAGCNSKANIAEFETSRKVQNMIDQLVFEGNENLIEDIRHIKDVHRAEKAGYIVI